MFSLLDPEARLYATYQAPDLQDMENHARDHKKLFQSWPFCKLMVALCKYGSFRKRLLQKLAGTKDIMKKKAMEIDKIKLEKKLESSRSSMSTSPSLGSSFSKRTSRASTDLPTLGKD